jgi:hypothetical protein
MQVDLQPVLALKEYQTKPLQHEELEKECSLEELIAQAQATKHDFDAACLLAVNLKGLDEMKEQLTDSSPELFGALHNLVYLPAPLKSKERIKEKSSQKF